jgi:hypothetical protein
MAYSVGETYERWTAFIQEDVSLPDIETGGHSTVKSWRPGVRWVNVYPDSGRPVWDGEGAELRRIVAVTAIDGGGVRILYRRQWRKPDGRLFGKQTVRMTTPSGFSSWLSGRNSYVFKEIRDWRDIDADALSVTQD